MSNREEAIAQHRAWSWFSRAVAIPVRFSGRGPAGIPAGPGPGRIVRFVWIVFDSQRREVAPGCERPDVNDSVLVAGRCVAGFGWREFGGAFSARGRRRYLFGRFRIRFGGF